MRMGSGNFSRFQRGVQTQLAPNVDKAFSDFSGGYISALNREDVPANASPYAIDTEVNTKGRIGRVPGTTLQEVLTGHTTSVQVAVHAALEGYSELVLFDAPYIGVKLDTTVAWYNVGIPVGKRYSWTNFGGTLIFSNGDDKVYSRQSAATTVETHDTIPQAYSYASFAGRLFAGHAIIDGTREPLGVAWSTSDSDYTDFSNEGAGFELLINDMSAGDRIVAMRAMGLDFMAIVMRKSIWIARRTGIPNRPADFQPRVAGVGSVNQETCRLTDIGVMFLSDDGVHAFDGNTEVLVSEAVSADLLPLDYTKLAEYSAVYNPKKKHYLLFTPTMTLVFDTVKKRWYRRALVARDAVMFAAQTAMLTIGQLTGLIGAQNYTWGDLVPRENENVDLVFLALQAATRVLAKEDVASMTTFAVAMSPTWELPMEQHHLIENLVTTKQISFEYMGSGTLAFHLPNNESQYALAVTDVLPNVAVPTARSLFGLGTGKGLGLRLVWGALSTFQISRVQLVAMARGPKIATQPVTPPTYTSGFGN